MAIQSISIVFECCILRVLFLNEFMAVSIDLSTKAHAKRDVSAHLKSTVGGIVLFSDLGYCACTAKGGNTVQNLGTLLANYHVCTLPQVLSLLTTLQTHQAASKA